MRTWGNKRLILIVVLPVTVALFSLALTWQVYEGSRASADPPPRATLWYWPLLAAEEAKPRPDGVFSGVAVGSEAQRTIAACSDDKPVRGMVAPAYGTELDPRPGYLPPGTEPSNVPPTAGYCGEVVVSAEQAYFIPPDPEAGRFGGELVVYRAQHRSIELDYAADRVEQVTIAGRPSIVIGPLTDDGFGNSAVVINETFGITVVRADGITKEELLRVAESLVDEPSAASSTCRPRPTSPPARGPFRSEYGCLFAP